MIDLMNLEGSITMKVWKKGMISFLVFILISIPLQAQALTVIVDPGHGGKDPGAIGVNGLEEKSVNLKVAHKLREELEKLGYTVLMTSEEDNTLSLQERVSFKESHEADLFVSVHSNSHPTAPQIRGSLVLYYDNKYPMEEYPASPEMAVLTPYSKQLATLVLEHMTAKAGTENRGIVPSSVYVVRNGSIPSILVETAFLSNEEDAALLEDDEFLDLLAQGIAEGIAEFEPDAFADIEGHWAESAILRMKDEGIVEGYRYRFHPEDALSRIEFLTMIDRVYHFTESDELAEQNDEQKETSVTQDVYEQETSITVTDDVYDPNEVENTEGGSMFTDMQTSHWGYDIMVAATKLNIVQGYPDQSIRPDAPITRAEVATILHRLYQKNNQPISTASEIDTFEDVPNTAWYSSAVYDLVRAQLLQGMGDGLYEPARNMKRSEAAVLFDRIVQ